MDSPVRCDNCDHVCEYDDAIPAKHLSERLDIGGQFTDVECPKCGTLMYPEPEFTSEGTTYERWIIKGPNHPKHGNQLYTRKVFAERMVEKINRRTVAQGCYIVKVTVKEE